jgi:anti-sigma regulatory factor (Ser/Thr protein kinase)
MPERPRASCEQRQAQRYRHPVLVTLDLPPNPASVGEARRFTVDTLRRWDREDLTTSGALLVTELVTNAILHARTMVRVILERGTDFVRVEVRDGSLIRPALRNHGLDATTGRGLALVSRLADTWGVDVDGTGKVVWAHLTEDWEEESSEHLYVLADVDDVKDDVTDDVRDSDGPDSPPDHDGEPRAAWSPALGLCA